MPELWSGKTSVIDGIHCLILDPGLLAVPLITRRLRHRYVLLAHKRDAAQFSQLREREGANASYFELESGGWLVSWHHETKFVALNTSEAGANHYRRVSVVEVICGTGYAGLRRLSGNYWGIIRVVRDWRKIRGGMLAVWGEACETARRMNQDG